MLTLPVRVRKNTKRRNYQKWGVIYIFLIINQSPTELKIHCKCDLHKIDTFSALLLSLSGPHILICLKKGIISQALVKEDISNTDLTVETKPTMENVGSYIPSINRLRGCIDHYLLCFLFTAVFNIGQLHDAKV